MNFEEQMQRALQSFIVEAQELLVSLEQGLLALDGETNGEAVNALFRAAHTIKGSAGLFGLDGIVRFTHHLETLLDQIRGGLLQPTSDVVNALLDARDHLALLIENVEEKGACDPDTPQGAEIVARLQSLQPSGGKARAAQEGTQVTPALTHSQDAASVKVLPHDAALTPTWHLSLRFGPDCLRNGMDHLAFIRYLRGLGEIVGLVTLTEALPALDAMDPETSYLGFEINFRSEASKEEIEGVFEFVRDDSVVSILPAHSRISDYIELIRTLPEDEFRLGDILVQVGTLTRKELDVALATQQHEQAAGGSHAPLGEILVREGATHAPIVEAALDKQKQVKDKRARDNQMLRVAADKLDALINLVGELVIAGAGNSLQAQRSNNPAQIEAAAQVTRMVEEIRERALKLRMVEIGETFARFQRVVRDTARELGKDIALVIQGGDTEMDKTLVERIADPLMHLVRNSIDHGIEGPAARLAKDKPAQGTLRLSALHDSGSIVIEVADDGAGLNRDRILAKAIERGLVSAEVAQAMPDAEVWTLIFEPGFSTAEALTDLSGRGVGMDVVKRNIEAIRGSIDVQSVSGQGATIRLRLPLTLAIIDGFMVSSGGRTYVLPLDSVVECMEHHPPSQAGARGEGYINLRGEVLPLIYLREVLGAQDDSVAPIRRNVVIVQAASQRAGLVVDGLLGEYQTVIKSLGPLFSNLSGIGGSTILGSGEVALILDAPALIGLARRAGDQGQRAIA
ncbi:MAG: chemotaxis protein CheA [Proteobacteria bacterium]|nr:chemotaxis protein CheA [Pseudomonadota bacterium]